MYQPAPSNNEEVRVFEFMLAREFGAIRTVAREEKIEPEAVGNVFDFGYLAASVIRGLRLGRRGTYPADMTLDDALGHIRKYAEENHVSPLEVIRFVEIGRAAAENLKLHVDAYGRRILPGGGE